MAKIYFEKNSERFFIAESENRAELMKAGLSFIREKGYTPNKYWSNWTGANGEEYMDFGSWSAFLVLIKE